ncbi:MAG: hypothetical protein ACTSV0_04310, partial [Candidatus Freyarchaeota archaeon]
SLTTSATGSSWRPEPSPKTKKRTPHKKQPTKTKKFCTTLPAVEVVRRKRISKINGFDKAFDDIENIRRITS